MPEETDVRELVRRGATFMEVMDHFLHRGPHRPTPLRLVMAFQVELGISFVETRKMLRFFDAELQPVADVDLINERGRVLLGLARTA
ncbi:hypothetical protein [Streptomyces sp. NPDC050856]|uniref:hypothetical protein n=1 Tax=Streptomyces sp. NPDC050856 TaxID=3154939 RepID=UPI0033D0669E